MSARWPHLLASLGAHACCMGLLFMLAKVPAQEEALCQISLVAGLPGAQGAGPASGPTSGPVSSLASVLNSGQSSGLNSGPSSGLNSGPSSGQPSALNSIPRPAPLSPASSSTPAIPKKKPPRPRKASPAPTISPAAPTATKATTGRGNDAATGASAATTDTATSVSTGTGTTTGTASGTSAATGTATGAASGPGASSGIFAAQDLDSQPAVTRRVSPSYPPLARKQRLEGRVLVRLVVDSLGMPTQCAVASAQPPDFFEESALQAARKMRFRPGIKNGKPVKSLVLLPFLFRLH